MSHHPVQFSNWRGAYFQSFPKLSKFCFQIGLFCSKKNSYLGQIFKINLEAYLYCLQIKFKHKIPLSITYVIQFYKGDSPLGRKGKRAHSCETIVNETLRPRKIIFIRDYKWHFLRIWQFYQRWDTIFHPLTRYREIFPKTNLRPVWCGKQ